MLFTIEASRALTADVRHMRLRGDTRGITRAGQFVQISVPGLYLRRPISVCDLHADENGTLDIIFKTVGRGTEAMATMREGETLDLLVGLGNGYDIEGCGANASQCPLVIGGGVGAPPMYALLKALLASGRRPRVLLGFGTAGDVFWLDEFKALGAPVTVTTVDGSIGERGLVTDAMKALQGSYDYIYACGPLPMLKAVHALGELSGIGGQYSFEERMGCGFGACMGCTHRTKHGYKRICKDGPVLTGEEIVW